MTTSETKDEMRAEYDFSQLKIVARGPGRKGPYTIKLAPDVAEMFPTEEAVNEALRFLIRITKQNQEIRP